MNKKNFLQVVSTYYNLHVKNLLAFMKILFEFHLPSSPIHRLRSGMGFTADPPASSFPHHITTSCNIAC